VKDHPSDQTHWFSEELHPHDSALRAYLHSSFPSLCDVDDVVQDSYVKVLEARKRGKIESVKAYLFATARNATLALLRRRRIYSDTPVTDPLILCVSEDGTDVAEKLCTAQEIAILLDAIDALPGRCREIFILRKLQGVPQKEIARRLGLSEQTVQVQIGRGARKCARYLRDRGVTGRFGGSDGTEKHDGA
jgi:RNA polymerase sigma factor (sigma-70 family)